MTTTSTALGLPANDGLLQGFQDDLRKAGVCVKCGETRTHVRIKSGLLQKSKLKPITSENRDGTYEIYKGYCLGPKCFRLNQVKQLLKEEAAASKKTSSPLKKRYRKKEKCSSCQDETDNESEETEDTAPTDEDEFLPKKSSRSSNQDVSLVITETGKTQVRTGRENSEILELMSQEPAFRGKQVTIHMDSSSQEDFELEEYERSNIPLEAEEEYQPSHIHLNDENGLSDEEDHDDGDGDDDLLLEIASVESENLGIFTIQEEEEEEPPPPPVVVTPTKQHDHDHVLSDEEDEFEKQMAALVASRSKAHVFSPAKNKYREAIRPTVPTSAGRRKVLGIAGKTTNEDDITNNFRSPRTVRSYNKQHGTTEEPPLGLVAAPTPLVVFPNPAADSSKDDDDSRDETVVGKSLDASGEAEFSSVDFDPDSMDDSKSTIVSDDEEEEPTGSAAQVHKSSTSNEEKQPFDEDDSHETSTADGQVKTIYRQYSTTSPNASMDIDEDEYCSDEDPVNSSFRSYATTSLEGDPSKETQDDGKCAATPATKSNVLNESTDSSSSAASFPRYTPVTEVLLEEDNQVAEKFVETPATKSTVPMDLNESTDSSVASFPRYAPVAPSRKSRSGPVDLDEISDCDFSDDDSSREGFVTPAKSSSGPVDLDELDDLEDSVSPLSDGMVRSPSQPVVVANGRRAMPKRSQSARTFGAKDAAVVAAAAAPLAALSPQSCLKRVSATPISATVFKERKNTKTGIAFKRSNGSCIISKLTEGGLFLDTDLKVGDFIVSVNNVDCQGKEIKFVANLVRIAKGKVTVVAMRGSAMPISPDISRSSRKTVRSSNTKSSRRTISSDDCMSVVSDISAMTDAFGVASPRSSARKSACEVDDSVSVSSTFTTTTARPADSSFSSSSSNDSQPFPEVQDESYRKSVKSGVLWLTLVGQHVRFPKTWFQGARAPHMGVSNLLTKQGTKEPQHRWAYIARDVFHSEPLLNEYVPSKLCPGRLIMHIVIRDESWRPVQDVAIGCYHPYSQALTNEKGEDSRVLYMGIRRRSGHRVGSTALIDPVLASECRIQDIQMESPLGRGKRVYNKNLLAIFGDQPPVQTVFILETELVKKVRASREREYITDFKPITLLLLELFLQSKVEL